MARRRRKATNGHDTTDTGAKVEPKDEAKDEAHQDQGRYRIVRFFRDHTPSARRVRGLSGLTLEQAQKHCRDPETSSSTCRSSMNLKRTAEYGPWFDGYEVDRG